MDEEKKWEGREQLGPYQLEEQMPQSPDSPGELYRATHEESGATALVLKPAEEDKAPLQDLRVLVSSSASERYVAMQVEQTPWSVSPERQSVESLACTFEGMNESVQRMARALEGPEEPRPLWRLGLALAGAAAVCALVIAVVRLGSGSPPPSGAESLASTPPEPESHDEQEAAGTPDDALGIGFLADTLDAGESVVIARPLPREPLKGQKRPPCTRYVEVELVGACWAPHKLKAPCPDALYEYQGECYIPAYSARSQTPQSFGP